MWWWKVGGAGQSHLMTHGGGRGSTKMLKIGTSHRGRGVECHQMSHGEGSGMSPNVTRGGKGTKNSQKVSRFFKMAP